MLLEEYFLFFGVVVVLTPTSLSSFFAGENNKERTAALVGILKGEFRVTSGSSGAAEGSCLRGVVDDCEDVERVLCLVPMNGNNICDALI